MNDTLNDPGLAGIFATYPASWLSVAGGVGDQVSHKRNGIAKKNNNKRDLITDNSLCVADLGYNAFAAVHLRHLR